MRLTFLKDYRSRAWMCRYPAGAVVDIDHPEVLRDVLEGGFAESEAPDAVDSASPPEAAASVTFEAEK
jgi:hypothetical protein